MLNLVQQYQSEFVCALTHHQSAHKQFIQKISKKSKISPQLALDIYRNNTRGARLKSLEIIYSVCKKILGDETFYSIAKQYAIEDTEGLSDLNHYGESFILHLKSLLEAGRLSEDYGYLADLASLEYKMHAAYYANTDPEFPFKLFEEKINNKQQVVFIISSALGLIASTYPVYEIWKSNKEQQYVEKIKAIEGKQYLLIYRNEYKPSIIVINKNQYIVIEAIINKFSLQKIINDIDCDVNNVLPILISNKWVVGIK